MAPDLEPDPDSADGPLLAPPTEAELERARRHRQILVVLTVVLVAAPLLAALWLVLR